MPFVLVLALPEIISGIVAIFGAAYGVFHWADGKSLDDMKREIEEAILGWLVSYAAQKAGLTLDANDPLSDASLSGAVSERLGFTVRTLKDKASLAEDLEDHATALISQRAGYQIHSVRNVAVLRNDLEQIGCAILSQRLGIPAGVLPSDGEVFDAPAIKGRLLSWAKAEILQNASGEISGMIADIQGFTDFESLAAEMNGKLEALGSVEQVSARKLALMVANRMATNAVADYGRVASGMSKRTRRQLQLRDAQRKFRAAHGNRQQYVPLGMAGNVG